MYKKPITKEIFIEEAKKIHGDKYDYSKVEYINKKTKVCIICPEHGEFWQFPYNHLKGCGCFRCSQKNKSLIGSNKTRTSLKDFIEKAKKIHGDKYDYSKVEYSNAKNKICIICPKHGEFWQRPNDHLSGYGCPKCSEEARIEKVTLTTEEFIERAKKVHGDKYDYSKVEYINSQKKVCIICPEHGEFWQRPANHLKGNGCPKCAESIIEEKVRVFLEENKIKYENEKTFKWLGRQRLDFYLPKYNIAIECQGVQHFKPIDFAGKGKQWANKLFENNKKRDKAKKELCQKNGVKIIYFNYNDKITILKKKIKWLQLDFTELEYL